MAEGRGMAQTRACRQATQRMSASKKGMKLMNLYNDPRFKFEFDESHRILKFLWSEQTASMTDEDFKRALSLYADFAEKYAACGLLVDVRNFKHRPGPDIGKWRDATIVPKYVSAGAKKFAYVVV